MGNFFSRLFGKKRPDIVIDLTSLTPQERLRVLSDAEFAAQVFNLPPNDEKIPVMQEVVRRVLQEAGQL